MGLSGTSASQQKAGLFRAMISWAVNVAEEFLTQFNHLSYSDNTIDEGNAVTLKILSFWGTYVGFLLVQSTA